MKIIAICNHKGGVGKTAVSMAVSEELHNRNYKTLFIDLDQQTNATQTAGIKTVNAITVYDILTCSNYNINEAIKKYAYGDILPGDPLLADAEVEMSKLDTPLTMLADGIDAIEKEYDYIIIDCPPALGFVSRNALVAADEVIVVVVPDTASIDGLKKVSETVSKIKQNRRLNPSLKIAGVVVNRYEGRGKLDKATDEQLPLLTNVLGTQVFNTRIRKCVAISQAQSKRTSLYEYAPKSNGAIDFKKLVSEYLNAND